MDDKAILERAARRVYRTVHVPAMLGPDDLEQEGALALLEADVDESRPEHEQQAYRDIRATWAMRSAVRDARLGPRGGPDHQVALDYLPDTEAPDTPLRNVQTIRAAAAAHALKHPLPFIFSCLLLGIDKTHIAAHLGVSNARVSQRVAELRAALTPHLGDA